MRVQIAICTWNRARLLDRTLDAMRHLDVPPEVSLELLLVDNNCSDDTQEVIRHYADMFDIRSLSESKQGHSHARNRAIEAADGDLLLWTDDDVLVDEAWLAGYVAAARSQPEMAFWGGPIIPRFDQRRPRWLKENWKICKSCFAARDLGDRTVEFDRSVLPYGANFGVRTAVQAQFRFDPRLGRQGSLVLGDDEIDVLRRLLEKGHRGCWLPDAKVQHLIPPERTTESFVGEYYFGQGKREAMQNWRNAGSKWRLRWEGWTHRCLYRVKRPYAASKVWLTHLVRSSLARGKLQGLQAARLRRQKRHSGES